MMHFEKTEILFYTDGGAGYPNQEVKLFSELPDHQKNRIFLHCCTQEANATSLQMIVNEMNCSQIKSDLKENFQVTDLQKTWAEVLSAYLYIIICLIRIVKVQDQFYFKVINQP